MVTLSELDSFKLSDAIKFHNRLNPNLWKHNKLDPEVRDQLIIIADDFISSLGVSDLDVVDITISGSNAAYSYTPHSDLDLHVVVDISKLRDDDIYRELFTAKKTLYNDSHAITVHGVPVELYVQDANEPVVSLGEYSVLHNRWLHVPKKQKANFDEVATIAKYENLAELVELSLKTKDLTRVEKTIATIKRYRKAGLAKGGEFSPENIAFKAIRKQGGIDDLYNLRAKLRSEKLSIEEDNTLLDKPELTVGQLATRHGVSRMEIATQLDKGTKVELEHTSNRDVAREIALAHLAEDPKYYDKLDKIELDEEQLIETAEESQLINLISKSAAAEICKMLRKKESALANLIGPDIRRQNLEIYGISAEKLGVPYINDPILGSVLHHAKFRVANYLDPVRRNRIASYDPSTHDITVHYPAIIRDAKDYGYDTEPFLAKILSHEIQHAVDDFKSKGKMFSTKKTSYDTLPYEINARFQEALMNMTIEFDRARKEGKTLDLVHLPAFIDGALRHNQIVQFLPKTGRRYKQLVKRLYKFFETELNNPKQEQPLSIAKRAMNYILGKPTGTVTEDSEQLGEIGFANDIGPFGMSDEQIISNSTKDSTIGGRPVFLFSSGPNDIYFFASNSMLDAFVYLQDGYLKGMKTISSNNKGLIYNLFQYIINIKGRPIRLGKDDILTQDGITWILKQLQNKETGFKINDQHGNPVNPDSLYDEWETARTTGISGPTEIRISESNDKTWFRNNESLLMPMDRYGASLTEVIPFRHSIIEVPELIEASGYIPGEEELTEWTDSPYPYNKLKQHNDWKLEYEFTTKEGNLYDVAVAMHRKDIAVVNFNMVKQDTGAGTEKLTGTGDSIKVLSTVVNIVKDAVSILNPKYIMFEASTREPSRIKLYATMGRMAAKALPNYKLKSIKDSGASFKSGPSGYSITTLVRTGPVNEASGYIPSAKEKNDPRFKNALTKDVRPDAIKKNAKAFGFKTSRAGIPPQANPNGKIAEELMKEWKSFLSEDQEQQELFPGYNEKHRQERLNAWLGKSHAMAGKKPQVLYHATTKDFDQFRSQNQGWVSGSFFGNTQVDRSGIFLAVNPKFAEEFIKHDGNGPEWKENALIIPVYLSAQYPFSLLDDSLSRMCSDEATVQEFKEHDIDLGSIYHHFYEDKRWELFDGPEGEEFVRNLKSLGYDSAVMREEAHSHGGSEMVWVAFDPTQVKAITNRGSFSPADPRMMKEDQKNAVPKIGYHVTATKNLPIIQKNGIKADKRGNSYIWDSREMAEWFMDFQNDEGQDRTILKIDMSGLDANPDPEAEDMSEWSSRFKPGTNGGAWIISGPIPSDKIIG